MKVKISLNEEFTLKRHNSVKEDQLIKRKKIIKDRDIYEAVQWCKENCKRGYAAIKTGFFPSIKDARTVNAYLDGEREIGEQNRYQNIMTKDEEDIFVRYLTNKNRLVIDKYKLALYIYIQQTRFTIFCTISIGGLLSEEN